MFTQIQMVTGQSFTSPASHLMELASWHTHHFTFGENIFGSDCLIPHTPFKWKPTRQPVCLDFWDPEIVPPDDAPFTALMNWNAGKTLIYNGKSWGQKDLTFPILLPVPGIVTTTRFKVVVNTGWSAFYPTGKGLFPFSTILEATEAIKQVSSEWKIHSLAATEIARAFFDHTRVLNAMINDL